MKFHKVMFYTIKRLAPIIGIAGATALAGCEKEDDMKTAVRSTPVTQHDTVYVPAKTDTVYIPKDTIYVPGDTIYLPGDTIFTPCDTIYIPGDTVFAKPDTIYVKPDTVYTPSKPDTIYLPSKPDTIYLKPDTVYIEKPDTPPATPHHNTTYIWGDNNWDAVWPADKVAASADSALVDNVYLKNDGKSLGGLHTSDLMRYMNMIIESVPATNRYKLRGAGTLHESFINSQQDVQDSIKLSQFGFSFGKVRYGNFQR